MQGEAFFWISLFCRGGKSYDFLVSISSFSFAISSSTVMTVVWSVSRSRTLTVPFSTSFAPMMSM